MNDLTALPIALIDLSYDNVRQGVDDLSDLVESIQELGILQPLVVCENRDDRYTLVCGHRRLMAAKEAGFDLVPVVVRKVKNRSERIEVMLSENIHRRSMSPIEEGLALKQLVNEGLSQATIVRRLGKSVAWVSNRLNALRLPPRVRERVHAGDIGLHEALKVHLRQKRKDRGHMRADDRRPLRWQIAYVNKILGWVMAGMIDWKDEVLVDRLRRLHEALEASPLGKEDAGIGCSNCGTTIGYISKCCSEHDDRLCEKCFELTHEGAA